MDICENSYWEVRPDHPNSSLTDGATIYGQQILPSQLLSHQDLLTDQTKRTSSSSKPGTWTPLKMSFFINAAQAETCLVVKKNVFLSASSRSDCTLTLETVAVRSDQWKMKDISRCVCMRAKPNQWPVLLKKRSASGVQRSFNTAIMFPVVALCMTFCFW